MNFLLTYDLLENLAEGSGIQRYRVSYYEDGVKKSFTVKAASREEAKSIAWSEVDADDIWVELDESTVDQETDSVELSEGGRRIVSDPDVLYHYTRPLAMTNIFKEDCMRADLNCDAVCFTTDATYPIYDQPCGLVFSRKRITDAGYTLEEYDDFEEMAYNPDGRSESEERIYENVKGVSKLVTGVVVKWDRIGIVDSPEGRRIEDVYYDESGDEYDTWDLMLDDFTNFLKSLKSKGISVTEVGSPETPTTALVDGKLQYLDKTNIENPIQVTDSELAELRKHWNI